MLKPKNVGFLYTVALNLLLIIFFLQVNLENVHGCQLGDLLLSFVLLSTFYLRLWEMLISNELMIHVQLVNGLLLWRIIAADAVLFISMVVAYAYFLSKCINFSRLRLRLIFCPWSI